MKRVCAAMPSQSANDPSDATGLTDQHQMRCGAPAPPAPAAAAACGCLSRSLQLLSRRADALASEPRARSTSKSCSSVCIAELLLLLVAPAGAIRSSARTLAATEYASSKRPCSRSCDACANSGDMATSVLLRVRPLLLFAQQVRVKGPVAPGRADGCAPIQGYRIRLPCTCANGGGAVRWPRGSQQVSQQARQVPTPKEDPAQAHATERPLWRATCASIRQARAPRAISAATSVPRSRRSPCSPQPRTQAAVLGA